MVLTAAEIAEYQEYVLLALVHKYTREAVSVSASDDDWKMKAPIYGASTVDIACNYLSEGQLLTRDRGVIQIDTPTIMVSKDDTIKVGDRVTNIKASDGTVVLAGPLYVDYVAPAMGFGPVTNYLVNLSATMPKKW